MDKKRQKPYATDYNLLIGSILCQAHYQIWLVILLKCKYGYDNKKCETCGIKYKDGKCCLEYTNVKGNLIKNKCLRCNNNYQKKVDKNLKKRFPNTHKLSNHDINKLFTHMNA